MIHPLLLEKLRCPENLTKVALAETALIEKLNGLIAAGTLKNRAGAQVILALDGGLIREDGVYLYPIRDDIPVMLIDEAIPLDQAG